MRMKPPERKGGETSKAYKIRKFNKEAVTKYGTKG